MNSNPHHRAKRQLNYTHENRLRDLAEDRRRRRRAERLRLDLIRSRSGGGWTLGSRTDGAIVVGPRAFDWQIDEALDRLFAEARQEGLL